MMHQSKCNLSSSKFLLCGTKQQLSLLQQGQQQREGGRGGGRAEKIRKPPPSSSPSNFSLGIVANRSAEDGISWSSSPSSLSSTTHHHDDDEEEQRTRRRMEMLPSRPRRVTFDRVEIVELCVELGDHPCCRRGPALRMSGRVERQMSMPLKEYEEVRSPKRRPQTKLYLSSNERMKILRLGASFPSDNHEESANDHHDHPPRKTSSSERKLSRNDWSDPEQRIMQIDKIMNDLLARMDALDQGLAQQQQNHGKAMLRVAQQQQRSSILGGHHHAGGLPR